MNSDKAYQRLQQYEDELKDYLDRDLSESDTRAKFIDFFLRDVLGWPERNIERERTYWNEDGRAALDYAVGIRMPLFVLEAKRKNTSFEIPHARSPFLYTLNGEIGSCPNVWAAIVQARKYCDDHGVPYAVATNGSQFALFKAVTLHQGWKEGHAAVFDIGTLLKKHFREVYAALSYEQHSVHNLDHLLGLVPEVAFCQRVADDTGIQVGRLSNTMSDVIEQTVASILRDQPEPSTEFLQTCYSTDATTSFYAKSLRGFLNDVPPPFASRVQGVRPGHKKDPFARAFSANIERQGSAPPILVIGGKGHGKTSFLHWFFKASEFAQDIKDSIVLWVDFREAGYPPEDVERRVREVLVNQLENSSALHLKTFGAMKEVFREKIRAETERLLEPFKEDSQELERQIASLIRKWQDDTHAYLGHLLQYAQEHCKRRVIVVLDNADQKSTDFQIAVHDTSQQLATAFPVALLVSMRESTFFRLSTSARSDAFSQQQVFHIRTPSLRSVLSERFAFLSENLRKSPIKLTSARGFSLDVSNVVQFIALLSRSILEKGESEQILALTAAISNGDVRAALDLLHRFLVSGHTKLDDYFWDYAVNAESCIPYHEFLASVLLGEMAFYTEQASPFFLNAFSRSAAPEDSHFFRLRMLHVVETLSPGNSFRPEDFVPVDAVTEPFRDTGAEKSLVHRHLKTLLRFGLLQADTQTDLSEPKFEDEEFARIRGLHVTSAGKYYGDHLVKSFQYVYRILPDVTICDGEYFRRLSAIYAPFRTRDLIIPLDRAIEATRLFAEYLQAEETREISSGQLARSPILADIRFASDIRRRLEEDVKPIQRHLDHVLNRGHAQPDKSSVRGKPRR